MFAFDRPSKMSNLQQTTQQHSSSQPQEDGLLFLQKDHDNLRQLFARAQNNHNRSEKTLLVNQIVREVSAHASAEERYLYPLIPGRMPSGEMICERNYLDDQINKELLDFLEKHEPKNEQEQHWFDMTLNKFIEVELEHLKQEEQEIFPALRERLSIDELAKLERDLAWAKNTAPSHPHPQFPSRFGAQILHPIASAVDKVVDRFSNRHQTNTQHKQHEQQQQQQEAGDMEDDSNVAGGQTFPLINVPVNLHPPPSTLTNANINANVNNPAPLPLFSDEPASHEPTIFTKDTDVPNPPNPMIHEFERRDL